MHYLKMLVLAALLPLACAVGVEGFPQASILVDGEPVDVRLAATPETRAQGFQSATPEQIRSERILFTWPDELEPVFHMNNVAAPLVIAWIAEQEVVAVERMTPGQGGYRPPEPVDAALELAPEEAEALGIVPGATIRMPE
ncbi:DUF192 domain-containing protein [Halorhodospira halophila]|uniref:DUF192 domain-containing protein n=1 Tax=Halorhodospira halophila (strain DSM 244 / SL1) TaxID=349124 RepID=A1WUR9_HALHL|nr:DUF192 domain-containing protein [Halorhodospira halophila]ABM61431.1 protein of unknown function DUF192 [Halorhodospira halophila SL1]